MNLLIIGHARHGKDTVCKLLTELTPLTFSGSSLLATDLGIFDEIIKAYIKVDVPSIRMARQKFYENKGMFRQEMYEAIRAYNAEDKTRLAKEIFKHADIYCGLRDKEEFDAIKRANLTDLIIWVDASLRLEKESKTSMKLDRTCADIIIENNGSLSELKDKVERLAVILTEALAAEKEK